MKDTLIGFGAAAILIWLWESGKLKTFVNSEKVQALITEPENKVLVDEITEIEFVP